MLTQETSDVLIIGGGVAGLMAGIELVKNKETKESFTEEEAEEILFK